MLNVPLRNRLNVDVRFGVLIPNGISEYEAFDALISAGANITDLEKFYNGEFGYDLLATIVGWYRIHHSLESHITDESLPKKKPK